MLVEDISASGTQLQKDLLTTLCPEFWIQFKEFFKEQDQISPVEIVSSYASLFAAFYRKVGKWLDGENHDSNALVIKSALLLDRGRDFQEAIKRIYQIAFAAYRQLHASDVNVGRRNEDTKKGSSQNPYDEDCEGCQCAATRCQCEAILASVLEFSATVAGLDLGEQLTNPAIVAVVYDELTAYISRCCRKEFFKPCLQQVFDWMNKAVLGWLSFVIQDKETDQVLHPSQVRGCAISAWRARLEYFVYKVYAELRISELFEIIVEYPESLPAVNDLKECLSRTESRKLLTDSLKEALQTRLLHPAVNTDDILTQYVSAIRTLRELDPTGVILENVCSPLREYLRSRDDTIKCIITCLTDQESGPDLAEELFGSAADSSAVAGDDADSDGENWTPDPIDAKTDLSSQTQRTADIINILVNIYGSKDMFVSQYRTLLADRILTNFSYDVVNERRYLELLKRRFGESQLHFCDIMLKDVMDSYRINRHINDELKRRKNEAAQGDVEFNAFILSSAFWPTLAEDAVVPPEAIKNVMAEYTKLFQQSKGMRTLEWLHNLGSVEVEIELEDGKKCFHATPAQATLILKFHEKSEWTLSRLSKEMNVSSASMRGRLAFWVGHGVLIEKHNDVFVSAQTFQSLAHDTPMFESDDEVTATSSRSQKEEELQTYWSYVVGMLTNLGALPLDRIHSMLKMFASQGEPTSQCTADEVKAFLQGKVGNGELAYLSGMYRLPKS